MMVKRAFLLSSCLMLMCTVFGAGDVESSGVSSRRTLQDGRQPKNAVKGRDPEVEVEEVSSMSEDSEMDMELDDMTHMSMSMKYKGGKGGKGGEKGKMKSSASHDSSSDKGMTKKDKSGNSSKEGVKQSKAKSGKGKSSKSGKDKSAKGSKKSSKSSKSEKSKGKGGGGGGPTPVVPVGPTTPSPTSSNSIPIRVSPYSLLFSIRNAEVPSTEEFRHVGEVTRVYLETFMIKEFGQTSLTNLDDFLTVVVRNSFSSGNPIQVEFRSTGLFNPSSIFLPTVRELDGLITQAFTGDNLVSYLSMIQNLPGDNQFSDTRNVELTTPIANPRGSNVYENTGADPTTATIGAAAAGIVVLAAGLIFLRGRRNSDDGDCDESVGGKGLGDGTVADETCTTSLCASSDARSWKRDGRILNLKPGSSEDEQDRFQDEYDDDKTDAGSLDDDDSVSGPPNECFIPSRPNSTAVKS